MFPDTANFTDPTYTGDDPNADPLLSVDPYQWSSEVSTNPGTGAGLENAYATGGSSSSTPAQGSSTGASLFGWLNLASNIARTGVDAARGGSTTRPGVNRGKPTVATNTTMTFGIIAVVFIVVILLLRK